MGLGYTMLRPWYCCLHSSLLTLGLDFLVPYRQSTRMATHGYVLKASFCKLLIKFACNHKLAQSILRRKLPSQYEPGRFWNANFRPYISPSEFRPLKNSAPQKGLWKNISPGPYFQNFTVSLNSHKPVRKTYSPKNDNFCLLMTFPFPLL